MPFVLVTRGRGGEGGDECLRSQEFFPLFKSALQPCSLTSPSLPATYLLPLPRAPASLPLPATSLSHFPLLPLCITPLPHIYPCHSYTCPCFNTLPLPATSLLHSPHYSLLPHSCTPRHTPAPVLHTPLLATPLHTLHHRSPSALSLRIPCHSQTLHQSAILKGLRREVGSNAYDMVKV